MNGMTSRDHVEEAFLRSGILHVNIDGVSGRSRNADAHNPFAISMSRLLTTWSWS